MNSSHLHPSLLNCLPVVIDAPGVYLTRKGEKVQIETISHNKGKWNCRGVYIECKIPDSWHFSGRLFSGRECDNDIVSKECGSN